MPQSNQNDLVVKAVENEQNRSKNSRNWAVEEVDNEYAYKKSDTLAVKAVDIKPTKKNLKVGQLKQLIIHAAVQP